ncbi:MAG TPA: NAD(P)H-binding protein [Planktothrix sp.]|jgi:NADH dehydrogenase
MAVVAITGGTGFIGAHLARQLVARGHFARLLARGITHRDDPITKEPNVHFSPAGVNEEKQLTAAFGGADAVCHLVGINREKNSGDFEKVHVQGTRTVVTAANHAQVKKIVFVSFIHARKSRTSGYLNTKWQAEEIIRNSMLDYTVLKPGMVYGHGDQMVASIVDGLHMFPVVGFWPTLGLLERPINPIFIDDMVDILIASLVEGQLSNKTMAVIGPDKIGLSTCVRRVAKEMKKPVLPIPMPLLGQYMMAKWMENVMTEPLLSVAQVRMLSEGMDKPLPGCEVLPADLAPKTPFSSKSIRASI